MTAGSKSSASVSGQDVVVTAMVETTAEPTRSNPLLRGKVTQRIALRPAGSLFSPQESLVWIIGALGVWACIVPWFAHGWLWFGLITTPAALLACYDAFALWLTREEFSPDLLRQEKGLRGFEGQTIQVPFALDGSGGRWLPYDVRAAVMSATEDSETAFLVKSEPQRLKLEQPESVAGGSTSAIGPHIQLWQWTAEITLLRRGQIG